MRESLFRAAQRASYFNSEETVGYLQSEAITRKCWEDSFQKFRLPTPPFLPNDDRLVVLWPYPLGTSDCIDRANCASHFVDNFPEFEVLTDAYGDEVMRRRLQSAHKAVVFCPYEVLMPNLEVTPSCLVLCGVPVTVVMSELIAGYLFRRGQLTEIDLPQGRIGSTMVVNGTSLALNKYLQSKVFRSAQDAGLRINALDSVLAENEADILKFWQAHASARGIVLRPLAASQGTGVMFLSGEPGNDSDDKIRVALTRMGTALAKKYGRSTEFPLVLTPFVESKRIDGCITDLRMFVVYDGERNGLASLPSMVRRAQKALLAESVLDFSNALSNLNAPPAADAIAGTRIFPATDAAVMQRLGLDEGTLLELSRAAAGIWASALETSGARSLFSYGSVDFILPLAADASPVPVELNGANVGSHPTVHPRFSDFFARATTNVLTGYISRT
jgi:hypothetical protein